MTVFTTCGIGAATAGETYIVARPKYPPKVARPVVIFCHGAGGAADYILTATTSAQPLIADIVNAGYTVLSCDLGGIGTWGNATVRSRMTDAWTYAQTLPGVATGRVILVMASMGGLSALSWAAANPTKVSCIFGVTPMVDLTDVWTNNRGGFTAGINAAYGGTYSQATYGAASNPVTLAAAGAFGGMSILVYYGATDDICIPARTAAFVTASGATGYQVTGGHDAVTYSNVSTPTVLAFLAAH